MANGRTEKATKPAAPDVGGGLHSTSARETGPDEVDRQLARERAEVAARIHDGLAQELTGLRMLAFLLARDYPQPRAEFMERVQAVADSADTAIRQVTQLTGELRTLASTVVPFASQLRKCCSAVRGMARADMACSRAAEMVDTSCRGAANVLDCMPTVLRHMANRMPAGGEIAVIACVVGKTLRTEIVMPDGSTPDDRLPEDLASIREQLAGCGGSIAMTRTEGLDKCVIAMPIEMLPANEAKR